MNPVTPDDDRTSAADASAAVTTKAGTTEAGTTKAGNEAEAARPGTETDAAPDMASPPRARDRARPLTPGLVASLLVDGAIAAVVAVVCVLYRVPPYPSDQLNYFDAATTFPSDPTYAAVHQFLRIGLIVPLRLAQEVFGYSQTAYLIVPVLAALLLVMSVHALGTLLFNRFVGVAAALLTLFSSLVFPDLTQPLPDLMATALLTAALVLTVALRQNRPWAAATRRRRITTLLAVGVLLGWSYLTREYIVFCWPLVPLLLARRVRVRQWLWIALPLAVVAVGETALNAVVFHDPLVRLRAAAEHGSAQPPASYDYIGRSPWWYLTRLPTILFTTPEGMFLKAAVAGIVVGALFSRRIFFLLVWALLFYVPLVMLGGLIDPEAPRLRIPKERYWLPLVPALLLAAAAGLWLLLDNRARAVPFLRDRTRLAAAVAGVATLVVAAAPAGLAQHARVRDMSGPPGQVNQTYAANGGTQWEMFRSWLDAHQGDVHTIWADRRSIRTVGVFTHPPIGGAFWHGRLRVLSAGARPAAGDHVLLYSAYSDVCWFCRRNEERLLGGRPLRPPANWHRVFGSRNRIVEVYQVR
ncbi:glycosyltransferase family 39 protein [Actinopolymorpha sp. NPDC004070]|uniref:glycosyltransferase family 39 protein n=1 Tax=Actinopolymorpha sp. NPDC004070 TaxID=3154548 RepID=UPI0033BF4FE0